MTKKKSNKKAPDSKVTLEWEYCECGCHCHEALYKVLGETLYFTLYNDLKGGFSLRSGHMGPLINPVCSSFEDASDLAASSIKKHLEYRS